MSSNYREHILTFLLVSKLQALVVTNIQLVMFWETILETSNMFLMCNQRLTLFLWESYWKKEKGKAIGRRGKKLNGKKFKSLKKSNFFPLALFSSNFFLVCIEAVVLQNGRPLILKLVRND